MSHKKDMVEIPFWMASVFFITLMFLIILFLSSIFDQESDREKNKVKEVPSLISAPETNITDKVISSETVFKKTNPEKTGVSTVLAQADINQALSFAKRKQAEARQNNLKDSNNQDFNPGKEGLIDIGR